jgi:hypothetical protein
MLKITSKSRLVMGILFAVSGLIYLVTGKTLLAALWLFCSAVHFYDAYRLWREEKKNEL